MSDGSAADRVLALKARRAQVQTRMDEWESTFHRVHGHHADAVERHRSSQYRELSRLLSDIDGFVQSIETGGAVAGQATRQGSAELDRRAGRGRTKARMRQWDREFERMHHRKPTELDHKNSGEFAKLQAQLHVANASPASPTDRDLPAPPGDDSGFFARKNNHGEAGLPQNVGYPTEVPNALWWQGNDYYELLRFRVQSQTVVNGFEGTSLAEVSDRHHRRSPEDWSMRF